MEKTLNLRNPHLIQVLIVAPYFLIQETYRILMEESGMHVIGILSSLDEISKNENLRLANAVLIYTDEIGPENNELKNIIQTISSETKIIVVTTKNELKNYNHQFKSENLQLIEKESNSIGIINSLAPLGKTNGNGNHKTNGNGKMNQISNRMQNDLQLSDCEKQLVSLIGRGLNNQKIAELMNLNETKIQTNLTSVYEKFEVTDRLNLVIKAFQSEVFEIM